MCRHALPKGQASIGVSMTSSRDPMHSFIVKIWQEEPAGSDQTAVWRGSVTHAVNRDRVYFTDVSEILPFINAYLSADAPHRPQDRRRFGRLRKD